MSPPIQPKRFLLGACVLAGALFPTASQAQEHHPERGLRHVDPRWHALVHATLVPAPGQLIEDATVVLRDGLIVSVRAGAAAPAGARVWDLSGLTVYAGLIDPHLPVEAPAPHAPPAEGAHWNARVTPQRSSLDGPGPSEDLRTELRALGFTAAATVPAEGIFRGSAAVIALGAADDELELAGASVVAANVYQSLSFDPAPFNWGGDVNKPDYPTSEMGAVALVRQTLSDANWYARRRSAGAASEPAPVDAALAALDPATRPTFFFDARHELQSLRAARLAAEFDEQLVLVGVGTEFRRLDAIAALGAPVIVPLAYPDDPAAATRSQTEALSLRRLQSWEHAPANPALLSQAGVVAAFTTDDLEDRSEFHARLRRALEAGLDPERALAMLTEIPARLLGVDDRLGSVEAGKLAHLVVVDGDLFSEDAELRSVWVSGRRYEIKAAPAAEPIGTWELAFAASEGPRGLRLSVADDSKLELSLGDATTKLSGASVSGDDLRGLLDAEQLEALGQTGVVAVAARLEGDVLHGTWVAADGATSSWSAARAESDAAEEDVPEDTDEADEDAEEPPAFAAVQPFGAYGYAELPPVENLLLTGATIWTGGPQGVQPDAALLVVDGRIAAVGSLDSIDVPAGVERIDATGLHITPGIIDCHSHAAIRGGVNEVGKRVTAECRIADVIDPDDMDLYRQLAGGLTAANLLHGSANAIGGQNAVIKLRWGAAHPDDMLLAGAPGGIKFALGENPKRVAAGTGLDDEYPQTRMGVATLIQDRLSAGRTYRTALDGGQAVRRDLELEAMGEIVAGERLVHSHSYRQDEILMLARTARDFGFKIGTFQHVLEGYKVAEAIAESALGASTFADWWQYKFEVIDAIPHNAALMHDVGVVVSINSDSNDHARRLNTEAAKSMKYGGLDPHSALQLVTLNPAIQLGVADRVGSLEPGKDADYVLWTGSPLSYASRPRATFIDGRRYFDIDRDVELRAAAEAERQRILQKFLTTSLDPAPDADDSDAEDESDEHDHSQRRGNAAFFDDVSDHLSRRGDCGCAEVHGSK